MPKLLAKKSIFVLFGLILLGLVATILLVSNNRREETAQAQNPEPVHVSESLTPSLWSQPSTWPDGVVPDATTSVIIPKDKRVILDISAAVKNITVRGTLEVADTAPRALDTGWLLVDGGAFKIGSVEDPFVNDFTLTIKDFDPDANVTCGGDSQHFDFGNHFVAAFGGSDMHGAVQSSTCASVGDPEAVGKISVHALNDKTEWTRLTQTVPVGANTLQVADATGWAAGESIVLASTDYDYRQSEKHVIDTVDGNEITLQTPVEFMHYGAETFGVEQYAEVANLDRRIVFRTAPVLKNVTSEGVVHGTQETTQLRLDRLHMYISRSGKAYLDGVHFADAGQEGQRGKYPFHWHHTGDASGQYVRNSVVTDSVNKCISLHLVNNAVVDNNITYNNAGHCVYLEHDDDNPVRSENNTLTNNLVMYTYRPTPLQRIKDYDNTVSGFWLTHPNNSLEGNVAAGAGLPGGGYTVASGSSVGYWYHLEGVEMPTSTITQFDNNIAHSNGGSGFWLDGDTHFNWYYHNADIEINDYVAYKNRISNFWIRAVSPDTRSKVYLNDARLADSLNQVYIASLGKLVYGYGVVNDSVMVGESDNKGTIDPEIDIEVGLDGRTNPIGLGTATNRGGNTIRAIEIYDGYTEYNNNTFVNFESNEQRAAAVFALPYNTPYMQHPSVSQSGSTLINANPAYLEPTFAEAGARNFVVLDKDGTLTGTANAYIVGDHEFIHDDECELKVEWNAYLCGQHHLVTLRMENEQDDIYYVDGFNFRERQDGNIDVVERIGFDFKRDNREYYTNVQSNRWYDFEDFKSLNGVENIDQVWNLDFELMHSDTLDKWLGLSYPLPYYPQDISAVAGSGSDFREVFSQESLTESSDSAYFYDYDTERVYVKMWVRDLEANLDPEHWGMQNEVQIRSNPIVRAGQSLSVNAKSVFPVNQAPVDQRRRVCGTNSATAGSVVPNPDNVSAFLYTAPPDFAGEVTVSYDVCNEAEELLESGVQTTITVLPDNVRPEVESTLTGVVQNSSANEITLSVTDDNFNQTVPGSVSVVELAKYGTLEVDGQNILRYTPQTDYQGPDEAIVRVCDELNECDLATLRFEVQLPTSISLSGELTESLTQAGVVEGSLTLTIENNVWSTPAELPSSFTFEGLPAGLTPQLTRVSDTVVGLSLDGTAQSHEPADSVAFLLNIAPEAFTLQGAGNEETVTLTSPQITFLENEPLDSDGDGVPDSLETQTPNGGDANNDGVGDKEQANVLSARHIDNASYVTLASQSEECAGITVFDQVESEQVLSGTSEVTYPQGLNAFEIECDQPGASTEVILYYHKDIAANTTRNFFKIEDGTARDITGQVAIDMEVIETRDVTTVTYTVADGGPLDADGTQNGVIVDPSGFGVVPSAQNEEEPLPDEDTPDAPDNEEVSDETDSGAETSDEPEDQGTVLPRTGGSSLTWLVVVGLGLALGLYGWRSLQKTK